MSFQEDVIHDLTGSALGRRFVFFPDEYRKGRGVREPADLAWYCRDTLVLMYMTQTVRGWQQDAEHNVTQARGWLRAWRDGRSLTGENETGAFAVPYDAKLATVVLSITADASLDQVAADPATARAAGVDLCATVSERFVRLFAQRGAGVSDLVALLLAWPKVKSQVPSLTDVEWFEMFRSLSMDKAADRAGWRLQGTVSRDVELATQYVRGFRAVMSSGSTDAAHDASALFADFAFSEQFQLLFTLGHAAEQVRGWIPHVRLPFVVDRYRGSVVVIEDSSWFPHVGQTGPRGSFEFVLELQLGLAAVAFQTIRNPSRSWQILHGDD
jgi:hypothetical protein